MKPNEIMPEAFENIPSAYAANVANAADATDVAKVADANCACSGEFVDMCTLQYYCPQPILGARLAHAYVPFQWLNCLYPPEKGLKHGTIFPELDRPYGTDLVYMADE